MLRIQLLNIIVKYIICNCTVIVNMYRPVFTSFYCIHLSVIKGDPPQNAGVLATQIYKIPTFSTDFPTFASKFDVLLLRGNNCWEVETWQLKPAGRPLLVSKFSWSQLILDASYRTTPKWKNSGQPNFRGGYSVCFILKCVSYTHFE